MQASGSQPSMSDTSQSGNWSETQRRPTWVGTPTHSLTPAAPAAPLAPAPPGPPPAPPEDGWESGQVAWKVQVPSWHE